jgi:hypothetical protein
LQTNKPFNGFVPHDFFFSVLESTIATAMEDKHVEPEGYQVISSALSQL